jgi:hypothetical protein
MMLAGSFPAVDGRRRREPSLVTGRVRFVEVALGRDLAITCTLP